MSEVRLQVKHVSKNFGITKALKDVSFNINKGEVHALIGENGSGKSTMTNMLTGIYTLESGQFILDGKEVHPKNLQYGKPFHLNRLHGKIRHIR